MANIPYSIAVVLCIALAPACVVWWYGRPFARTPDDPLLAERLQSSRLPGRYALAFSWALLVVVWPSDFIWAVPLMLVVRAAVAYPLRRVLYGETWSLPIYLWFFCRLAISFFGFWLTMLWLPELIRVAGDYRWLATAVLVAGLLWWSARYSSVVCRVMRTRPVEEAELVDGFARIAERAGLRPPRFEVLDMNGGVLANAVALPSRRAPAVLVTSTLLERFDRAEILAVLAHELAHIEHFDARRLARLNLVTYVLIATGALVSPLVRAVIPSAQFEAFALWFIAVIVYLALRARSKQKDETASDLRAVALTGDPDALINALVKLHTIGRVPRRWEANFERHATHPSLARRIQAIRSTAVRSPLSLEGPVAFGAGATSVIFHDDHLEWREGDLLTHTLGYTHLTELRVAARHTGPPRLVAVEKTGRRWEIPIGADDVPRAQAVLDVVDTRLAAAPSPATIPYPALRLLSIFTALTAIATAQFAVLLPTVLALLRPVTALIAAAGVAAITAAALAWREVAVLGIETPTMWSAIVLGACGCALVGLAWTTRKDDDRPNTRKAFAVLAACAALAWLALLVPGIDAVRLHQNVRGWPSATVLALSLGAGLLVRWSRAARYGSVPAIAAGLIALAIGSRTFLEWCGRDLFLASSAPLSVRSVDGRLLSESTIPVRATRLRLSPSGRHIAVATLEDGRRTMFHAGPPSGPFRVFQGDDALFVDDDHLLVVDRQRDGIVRELRLGGGGDDVEWEQRVPGLTSAHLWLNRRDKTWRVLGLSRDDEVVRAEGRIGEAAVDDHRWPARGGAHEEEDDWVDAIAGSRTHVLIVKRRYDSGAFNNYPFGVLAAFVEPVWTESHFTVLSPSGLRSFGSSRLEVDCGGVVGDDERPVCAAFDGTRTTLFALDLAAGRLEPLASLSGRLSGVQNGGSGWLNGWWNGAPVAIGADGREAWQVPTSEGRGVLAMAVGDSVIGSLSIVGPTSVVRLYARRSP